MERYIRNRETISEQDQSQLAMKHVAVAGCGGLGGYVLEQLARLGVGHLTAVDGDVFEESNLNRQLLATLETLGQQKAIVARDHLAKINPSVKVTPLSTRLTCDNARILLKGHDVIVDALDSRSSRMLLQQACADLNIPIVHGAIAGWYGQLAIIQPGARVLESLYPDREGKAAVGDRNANGDKDVNADRGIEQRLGNPAFAPGFISSLQVAETMKLLLGKATPMVNHVLRIDLLEMEFLLLPTANLCDNQ